MLKILLLGALAVVSWPLALVVAVVSAIGWLLLAPLRTVATLVSGVLRAAWAIVTLPIRPFLRRP